MTKEPPSIGFNFTLNPRDHAEAILMLKQQDNRNVFLRDLLQSYATNKISKKTDLDSQLKRQQILKLQLQNWLILKESGFSWSESKAILYGELKLNTPTLEKDGAAPIPEAGPPVVAKLSITPPPPVLMPAEPEPHEEPPEDELYEV